MSIVDINSKCLGFDCSLKLLLIGIKEGIGSSFIVIHSFDLNSLVYILFFVKIYIVITYCDNIAIVLSSFMC